VRHSNLAACLLNLAECFLKARSVLLKRGRGGTLALLFSHQEKYGITLCSLSASQDLRRAFLKILRIFDTSFKNGSNAIGTIFSDLISHFPTSYPWG